MRWFRVFIVLSLIGGFLIGLGFTPQPAAAADITLTDCTQAGLETAINDAATTDPNNPGIVTFDCTDNIIEFSNSYIGIGNDVALPFAVTIDGRNRGGAPIILDGQDTTRLFSVNDDGYLTLQYLTVQNGRDGFGGAIDNYGTVTISQSTFSHNQAINQGGAVDNFGTLTISQSTFSHNQADRDGGVIFNRSGGNLTISQSTFSHNQATERGGAIQNSGTLTITSSTFSGNTASMRGSTIYQFSGNTTISWSTIIQPTGTQEALDNQSVILGGEGTHCEFNNGSIVTDTYSLSNDTSCGLDGTGSNDDITYLDGLTNLGLAAKSTITMHGVEQTYYPLLPIDANNPTNPALNTGPEDCDTGILEDTDPEPDQLGNPRPFDDDIDKCDIGAIEFGNTPPAIQPASTSIPEGIPTTITISANDLDGNDLQYAIDCDTSDLTVPDLTESNDVSCSAPDDAVLSGLVTVTDGTATNTHSFTITVTNVAPIMTTLAADPPLATIGQTVTIHLSATDVPADTIAFTVYCSDSATDTTTPYDDPTAPVDSVISAFTATTSCIYTQPGDYTITAFATDDDDDTNTDGTSLSLTTKVQVVAPVSLCANRWNGSLSVSDECSRSETQHILPTDGPIDLCVNNWNGTTRASDRCSRSEHQIHVIGKDAIPACINTWTGTLRIADHCTRSEDQTLL